MNIILKRNWKLAIFLFLHCPLPWFIDRSITLESEILILFHNLIGSQTAQIFHQNHIFFLCQWFRRWIFYALKYEIYWWFSSFTILMKYSHCFYAIFTHLHRHKHFYLLLLSWPIQHVNRINFHPFPSLNLFRY